MSPNPTRIEKLNQGDKLGFRKSSDGRIEAVWKDQTYDFDKGNTAASPNPTSTVRVKEGAPLGFR